MGFVGGGVGEGAVEGGAGGGGDGGEVEVGGFDEGVDYVVLEGVHYEGKELEWGKLVSIGGWDCVGVASSEKTGGGMYVQT